MNIELMENAIVDRLKSKLQTFAEIYPIPDVPVNYKTPNNKGCIVYVAYIGEQPDNNQSVGEVSHHTTVTFQINYLSRYLRGEYGIYKLTSDVLDAVIGWQLPDAGSVFYEGQKFVEYENGIWQHEITISCRSLRAQLLDDEEEVFFTHLNIKNDE